MRIAMTVILTCCERRSVPAAICALCLAFSCALAMAQEVRIGGAGAALASMHPLIDAYRVRNPGVSFAVHASLGSAGGIKALAAGAIDLAVTSRPLKPGERSPGVQETEYARTPFVFAVSAKSAAIDISTAGIAQIYAGERVHWPDGTAIRTILRLSSDIDTDLVKSISPEIRRAVAVAEARPGVAMALTDQEAANSIERVPGAIGPTSLVIILAERRALRPLRLDGREPSVAAVASGSYPYSKSLFLVSASKRLLHIQRFMDFVQSPEGRRILATNGCWVP